MCPSPPAAAAVKSVTMTIFTNGLLIVSFLITFSLIFALEKTSKPPCCMDTLSSSVCQRLRHEKRVHFARRCNTDIEFRYVSDLDVWTYKQWSCSGYSPYMAFRACRKTCGFCDFDKVHYNLRNATDACRSIADEKERR
ncbi:hypothetical protein niasHT_032759 [Heterodera trifolii]|uniref:ShKT domain-containing protein n=1 Tax=Heterodera trifolii TaxID=157864 RepID=A0ABD2IGI9_9BILA